jgi:2-keto-3-deoxy-L-rhamnonate aldolase RhmA
MPSQSHSDRFPALRDGQDCKLGCTLGFGTPSSAQILARAGYDYLLIDMEHSPLSARETTNLVHTIAGASAGLCQSLVRVPSHGPEWIKWALDAGAAGIIVPMVSSSAEVERLAQMALYPPRGQRSFGPALAVYSNPDPASTVAQYLTDTSPKLALIPMIESASGLQHLKEIAAHDAVTAIFVGPVDLRMSLGLLGGDGNEAVYLRALADIVRVSHDFHKAVGIFAANSDACRKRSAEGFDFLLVRP